MILYPRLMQLDFNLLKVLYVLVEVQSTVKAAHMLHLSQPAVSKSLNKLRDYFKDDLFIRQGNQLHPTPLAQELSTLMPQLQQAFIKVLVDPLALPAAEWEGDISISAPVELLDIIALPITQCLAQITPNIRPMFRPINNDFVAQMSSGKLNIVFLHSSENHAKELFVQDVAPLSVSILCREGHPLSQKANVISEDLNPYPVFLAKSSEFDSSYLQRLMEQYELTSNIKGLFHSSLMAQQMLGHSDGYSFAFTQQQHILPGIQSVPFVVPAQYQKPIQVCIPRNMKNNSNMRWAVDQIRDCLSAHLSTV
ncbi:LysR family transcriptional regulator [Shewanella youngdeokensis]|uniref:LysR family transcriptional regulator n=1 Tax=Shewanella youngdeokensis TaxID=2999068 RepID=A0ABZ0K2B3_9GAMM|nr:LysR family transcriptional regulator [Shewanella sp. DAU334]